MRSFDQFVRDFSLPGTRRRLLHRVATVLLAAVFAAPDAQHDADAKGRRKKRRKKHHKNRTSPAVCTTCPVCQVCDPQTGHCLPQPDGIGCAIPQGGGCESVATCQRGACMPVPLQCPPPDQCQEPGVCHPTRFTCFYANTADGAPCDASNVCTSNGVCTDGQCLGTPLPNGAECGDHEHPAGGTIRCCNGGCSTRSCLPAGQPCDTYDTCRDSCCTGGTFGVCPGPTCVCATVGLSIRCASDTDCLQGRCVCKRCCAPSGTTVMVCTTHQDHCCSGACADDTTCA